MTILAGARRLHSEYQSRTWHRLHTKSSTNILVKTSECQTVGNLIFVRRINRPRDNLWLETYDIKIIIINSQIIPKTKKGGRGEGGEGR